MKFENRKTGKIVEAAFFGARADLSAVRLLMRRHHPHLLQRTFYRSEDKSIVMCSEPHGDAVASYAAPKWFVAHAPGQIGAYETVAFYDEFRPVDEAVASAQKPQERYALPRPRVYGLIDGERVYQEQRWGGPDAHVGNHSPEEWFMYIEDYVNEAKHLLSRGGEYAVRDSAMAIMRKVAAMAVCAMEENGAPAREEIFKC